LATMLVKRMRFGQLSDRPRDALCLPTIGGVMIRQKSRDESVQQNGED
jgi:hypothetical protein